MSAIAVLTIAYLALFNLAAIPSIVRIVQRQSSHDLSVWREWLVLVGVGIQFVAFWLAGASWTVLISPIASGLSLSVLLVTVYRFR